jgi:hypothetical protein
MRGRFAVALVLAALAAAARAETPCTPRALEKGGARFVEVCEEGFFLLAAPVACTPAEGADAACDPVTALEASPLTGPGKNGHVDALITDAARAERICRERFGGRLPTPLERERARLALGLATVRVREEAGEFARLLVYPQPEWVEENGARTRYPSVVTPPQPGGDVLLGCVAEPAQPGAQWVPIGQSCDERPLEGGVRSPDCAIGVPGTRARFELGCDPEHARRSHARTEDAAVRCVLPGKAAPLP